MGCVQQAVLEFDEEVRAPWRPRLVSVADLEPPSGELASPGAVQVHSSRPNPSRAAGRRSSVAPEGGAVAVRRARPRLRPTRRARRLALVLAVAAGVALGSWLAPLRGVGSGGGLRLAGVSSVVVRPGDTLWSIASPVAADGDVRATVKQIRQINGLTSADLVPGQTLQLQ
jgi:nucleoid-associated protein YgaU